MMLAASQEVWSAPRLAQGKPTSVATLAIAGSVAVHAAFLLAPGAPQRPPEPPAPATSVAQVQIIAPARTSGPALEPAVRHVKVAAHIARQSAMTKSVEAHEATVEREMPVVETAIAPRATAADDSDSVSHSPLQRSLPSAREGFAATPASTPLAFLYAPEPDYPASAREEGQEGLVVLRVRVSKEGRPVEIRIGASSGVRALDAAAVAGVRRWTFTPARVGGEVIEAWMDVPIRFRLT